MPNNAIPGINNPVQANSESGVQQTTHGGHQDDHGPEAGRHDADAPAAGVYSGAADATQSSRDPEGGAPGRSAGSADQKDHRQKTNPWYADDRLGLVVAGLLVAGVLVVAWAVHRKE